VYWTDLLAYTHQRLIQAKTRFNADNCQIERVRNRELNILFSTLYPPAHPKIRKHSSEENCDENTQDWIVAQITSGSKSDHKEDRKRYFNSVKQYRSVLSSEAGSNQASLLSRHLLRRTGNHLTQRLNELLGSLDQVSDAEPRPRRSFVGGLP